ncbi:unnamed protein product, partial [marine sediment metagenome]
DMELSETAKGFEDAMGLEDAGSIGVIGGPGGRGSGSYGFRTGGGKRRVVKRRVRTEAPAGAHDLSRSPRVQAALDMLGRAEYGKALEILEKEKKREKKEYAKHKELEKAKDKLAEYRNIAQKAREAGV